MRQQTFTDVEYGGRKRKTRREEFLQVMNDIIPWAEWIALIRPYYPKGKRGRPPKAIETMLRMYLLQVWFNLSDEGVEDAIYDSYAMRTFMGINFCEEQAPDATTLLHFRHLLEENHLGEAMLRRSTPCWKPTGVSCMAGRFSTRRSSMLPARRKIRQNPEIRKCAKS